MSADDTPVRRADLTLFRRQITRQELAEIAFADETDAGGVFLGRGRQAGGARHLAHVALEQFAQREFGRAQLGLAKLVQEIALVLAAVARAQQAEAAAGLVDPRVVAGGDVVGTQFARGVEEILELDLAVAQHVGIGRAAGRVLGDEVLEHAGPVLAGEIAEVDRQPEPARDRDRVAAIVLGAAVAAAVVGPVLHEQTRQGFAGIAQQQGRDRGIDPARHAHDGVGRPGHLDHSASGATECCSRSSEWRRPPR